MEILDLLCTEGYFMTNRNLVKNIGPMEALVVGYLASMQRYAKQNNMLEDGEYFYLTIDKMENDLTISKNYQYTILRKLEEIGLLSKKLIGLPAKRYFRINPNVLEHLLSDNSNEDAELTRKEINLIAQVCLEKDISNSLEEPLQKFFLNYKRVAKKSNIELIDIRSRIKRLVNFEGSKDKDLLEIIKISTEKGWRNFYSNNFKNSLDKREEKVAKKESDEDTEEILKSKGVYVGETIDLREDKVDSK